MQKSLLDPVGGGRRLTALVLLGLVLAACDASGTSTGPGTAQTAPPAAVTAPRQSADLRPLLAATRSGPGAEVGALLGREGPPREAAIWPLHTFLVAEVARRAGDQAKARALYVSIVEWAASDPYRDGWGGSGLAPVALWRWLRGSAAAPTAAPVEAAEARRVLDAAQALRSARLARGMLEPGFLEALSRLEEDTRRQLARLALAVGERDRARRLFIDYLAIASVASLDREDTALLEDVVASGLASRDRITLLRGQRLRALGKYQEARALASEARRSEDREVRAAAGLELARLEPILDERKRGVARGEVASLFASVIQEAGDPDVAQRALFARALAMNRPGPGRDPQALGRDLSTLVEQFPRGRFAADALYQLGRDHEARGDTTQAVEAYARLRRFDGPSEWVDSAYFRPAMALYTRSGPGDLPAASALLGELVERHPASPFRLKALFWMGRIAQESGDTGRAKSHFETVVREGPFDYYAIRARMWLRGAEAARRQLWPDRETREELRAAFAGSTVEATLSGRTAYHVRLDEAIRAGAYELAGGARALLRQRFPSRRVEELPPEELEVDGLLAHLAVLLALRQDALAAKDTASAPENRLQVAGAVGKAAGDWSLALLLANADRDPPGAAWAAQRDSHYLATAYPPLFAREIRMSSARSNIPPELLYGLVRMESLFNPVVLSASGGLGLAQFTPTTFDELDRRWRLLRESGTASREAFLTTPELALNLGARWLKDEILPRQGGDVARTIMEHNAGYAAVREWSEHWRQVGRQDDVEFVVETIGFSETHHFTRRVLTDISLVEAAGLLRAEGAGGR